MWTQVTYWVKWFTNRYFMFKISCTSLYFISDVLGWFPWEPDIETLSQSCAYRSSLGRTGNKTCRRVRGAGSGRVLVMCMTHNPVATETSATLPESSANRMILRRCFTRRQGGWVFVVTFSDHFYTEQSLEADTACSREFLLAEGSSQRGSQQPILQAAERINVFPPKGDPGKALHYLYHWRMTEKRDGIIWFILEMPHFQPNLHCIVDGSIIL